MGTAALTPNNRRNIVPIDTKNMIFVFGSNLGGIHGAGAAKFAREHRGAPLGVGVGHRGQSYAIPTKSVRNGRVGDTLPLETIQIFVHEFIDYACNHPELQFQVTCIGCGLAGLKHEDIAPMFATAPANCWFDSAWQQIFDEQFFGRSFRYWGAF
jgi:hypothetical protein